MCLLAGAGGKGVSPSLGIYRARLQTFSKEPAFRQCVISRGDSDPLNIQRRPGTGAAIGSTMRLMAAELVSHRPDGREWVHADDESLELLPIWYPTHRMTVAIRSPWVHGLPIRLMPRINWPPTHSVADLAWILCGLPDAAQKRQPSVLRIPLFPRQC